MGYWDPPEQEEPPECCGEIMEALDDGSCQCETCGKKIEPAPDVEPVDLEDYHSPENQCRECVTPNSSPPSPTPSAAASASDPHQCKSCREMSKMAHWELSCPSNNPSCVGTIITVQSSADSH